MAKIEYRDIFDDDTNYGTYAPFVMFGSGLIRSGTTTSYTIEGREDVSLEFVGGGFVYDAKGRPTEGFATSIIIRIGDDVQAVVTDVALSAKQLRGVTSGDKFIDLLGKIDAAGSVDDDYMLGGTLGDTLTGGDGDDFIFGAGGKDRLSGGDGDDILAFGKGKSVVDGGAGSDTTTFTSEFFGSAGDVDLTIDLSNAGFQKVGGGATVKFTSIEWAYGADGDDKITGNAETNLLAGGEGNDTVSGGAGDDQIYLDAGDDVLDGGEGTDTVYVQSYDGADGKVSLAATGAQKTGFGKDMVSGFENISSGSGDDKLTGDANGNRIEGGGGDDTISGGGGRDGLYGGDGNDVFRFNAKSLGLNNKVDIADFGDLGTDVMDLSAVDANSTVDGNQDFAFIEQAAFTGVAGQLRWDFFGGDPSRDIIISGDVNGDGAADLFIQLTSPVRSLTIADFDL